MTDLAKLAVSSAHHRAEKVFLFLRKQTIVSSGFAFWPLVKKQKKKQKMLVVALLTFRTGFESLRCLCFLLACCEHSSQAQVLAWSRAAVGVGLSQWNLKFPALPVP